MLFAKKIVLVFATFAHFFFQRATQVLEVNSEDDSTPTECVRDFDLLEVIDAEQIRNGGEYALVQPFSDSSHFFLTRIGESLKDYLDTSGIFVVVEMNISEHFVVALFKQFKVAAEHLLKFESLQFDCLVDRISHLL